MNKEFCVVCTKPMGNSLHKVNGKNVHVKCDKPILSVEQLTAKISYHYNMYKEYYNQLCEIDEGEAANLSMRLEDND